MKCLSGGVLYEDPYFPADDSSLFQTEMLPFTPKWMRPKVSLVLKHGDVPWLVGSFPFCFL